MAVLPRRRWSRRPWTTCLPLRIGSGRAWSTQRHASFHQRCTPSPLERSDVIEISPPCPFGERISRRGDDLGPEDHATHCTSVRPCEACTPREGETPSSQCHFSHGDPINFVSFATCSIRPTSSTRSKRSTSLRGTLRPRPTLGGRPAGSPPRRRHHRHGGAHHRPHERRRRNGRGRRVPAALPPDANHGRPASGGQESLQAREGAVRDLRLRGCHRDVDCRVCPGARGLPPGEDRDLPKIWRRPTSRPTPSTEIDSTCSRRSCCSRATQRPTRSWTSISRSETPPSPAPTSASRTSTRSSPTRPRRPILSSPRRPRVPRRCPRRTASCSRNNAAPSDCCSGAMPSAAWDCWCCSGLATWGLGSATATTTDIITDEEETDYSTRNAGIAVTVLGLAMTGAGVGMLVVGAQTPQGGPAGRRSRRALVHARRRRPADTAEVLAPAHF